MGQLLQNELNFIGDRFRDYEVETRKRCKYENYLSELLQMKSMQKLLGKYKDIQESDATFTLCNVNDKLIKDVESMKTTMVFCIEEKMSQALNQFRTAQIAI